MRSSGLPAIFLREPLIMLRADLELLRAGKRRPPWAVRALRLRRPRPARAGAADAAVAHRDAPLGNSGNAERIAECLRHLFEFEHLLGIGLFVNAMQRTQTALLQVSRDGLVGGEHELLDQAVRDVAFAAHDAGHAALGVEGEHALGQIEIHGAAARAARIENQRRGRASRGSARPARRSARWRRDRPRSQR